MERAKLHSRLEAQLTDRWNAYQSKLLALPPDQIIGKAAEITAARFCYDELTENPDSYPDYLLEHLLESDDPLEIVRGQWMNEQCEDRSEALEHALRSLWNHMPQMDESPGMDGMS